MPATLTRIKVKSLEFFTPPFRKLGNLKIEFSDRITLIAGHNGIGKSTILGLVANTFGMAGASDPRSYFGDHFYANIERIVYLALSEVAKSQENPAAAPVVIAEVAGVEVRKRCAMTQRAEWQRARVVPRTIDKAEGDPVGQDAKIPLPTIYLGIRRLATIGEAEEKEIVSKHLDMHADDSTLMTEFVTSVILGSEVTAKTTHQSIKGSKKKTAQPGYQKHDALAVSVGQDSLASIATALASFNQLQRDLGDRYTGGLLIIDELDVGFHPHAIAGLAKELKSSAKRLKLQIIATTHSPRLIEAIHPQGGGNVNAPDAVVYLVDTKHPRLAEDQSLTAVLNDMELRDSDIPVKQQKPALCIYFEDAEGAQLCDALLPTPQRARIGKKYGVRLKLLPLGVGGSNLIKLPGKDPIFKDRVLIVDADTKIPQDAQMRGNTLKLPCASAARGTGRSPENTLKAFLHEIVNATSGPLHEALLRLDVTNPSSDKVLSAFFPDGAGTSSQRESSKSWWTSNWEKLKGWGVVREWATAHPVEMAAFKTEFESAVAKTAERLRLTAQAKR